MRRVDHGAEGGRDLYYVKFKEDGREYCYALGDNRSHSRDSRHYGPVPLADVVGRVDMTWYPRLARIPAGACDPALGG